MPAHPPWTVQEAIQAQNALCIPAQARLAPPEALVDADGVRKPPHFAPRNGRCWNGRCRRLIYAGPRGVDGKALVTGCQYCGTSYCG